jgi:hypothetical protein
MTPDFHGLISQMAAALDYYQQLLMDDRRQRHPLADHARALLAEADGPAVPDGREPASVALQPSDEEVAELVAELNRICFDVAPRDADTITRAATLLQQQAAPSPVVAPVPASERLPGPEDCDEQGRCWLWERDCGYSGCKWALVDRTWSLSQSDEDLSVYTHWLAAHALPLPTPEAL